MVKIMAVCGAGLGSSFACQMAIEQALTALGVKAKVSHTDTSSVSALIGGIDIVVAGKNYQKLIEGKNLPVPVIFLDRLVDKAEITEKLTPVLREMGEIK